MSNTCGSMWLNRLWQNRESDEELDEDCVEEGFQMARVKSGRDGEGSRKLVCWIIIWDGSELELAWSKESSSYFENNIPVFLLSGISNTSIFKVRDFYVERNYHNIIFDF